MQSAPSHPPAQAFFLEAKPGRRFCLYHPPQGEDRGAVLHVPAHAEEMNKSRRMVALQARRLGIKSSLHKLRHYNATELLAARVDLRTVAGRLGHGGGSRSWRRRDGTRGRGRVRRAHRDIQPRHP